MVCIIMFSNILLMWEIVGKLLLALKCLHCVSHYSYLEDYRALSFLFFILKIIGSCWVNSWSPDVRLLDLTWSLDS